MENILQATTVKLGAQPRFRFVSFHEQFLYYFLIYLG